MPLPIPDTISRLKSTHSTTSLFSGCERNSRFHHLAKTDQTAATKAKTAVKLLKPRVKELGIIDGGTLLVIISDAVTGALVFLTRLAGHKGAGAHQLGCYESIVLQTSHSRRFISRIHATPTPVVYVSSVSVAHCTALSARYGWSVTRHRRHSARPRPI